jgi:hypothetical protein
MNGFPFPFGKTWYLSSVPLTVFLTLASPVWERGSGTNEKAVSVGGRVGRTQWTCIPGARGSQWTDASLSEDPKMCIQKPHQQE